ncbi:hypothetical protein [Massilia eburnea]|uniref:hypothetical protein n=1 Tax=Massilia eburnea TaxID=1776165 RepID=UPI003D6C5678
MPGATARCGAAGIAAWRDWPAATGGTGSTRRNCPSTRTAAGMPSCAARTKPLQGQGARRLRHLKWNIGANQLPGFFHALGRGAA